MNDRQRPRLITPYADGGHDTVGTRRRSLEGRLEDGYGRIDQALHDGADVAAWEEFWVQLLREYEAACDHARLAA